MADRNVVLGYGFMTVLCKSAVATTKTPSLAYLCTGQPGHEPHPASPRRQPPFVCTTCGEITDDTTLVRGVKQGQTYTIVDRDAVSEAKQSFGSEYKRLDLVPHPAQEFLNRTAQGDTMHYLTPADSTQADHYQLLARLIAERPDLAFTGLYTPSSATAQFHVTQRDGVLVMLKRVQPEAVKPLPSVGGEVNDKFYDMLVGTVDAMVEEYDPAAYEDKYAAALADLIATGETVSVDKSPVALVGSQTDDDLMAKFAALTKPKAAPKKRAAKKATTKKEIAA